jgi:hypothetical protein
MIVTLFCIYDSKADAFLPPWTLPTVNMARRTFADCVNDKNHAFGKHPHDYTLFKCGEFNDDNAQITPSKESLGNGVEYIEQRTDDNHDLFETTNTGKKHA